MCTTSIDQLDEIQVPRLHDSGGVCTVRPTATIVGVCSWKICHSVRLQTTRKRGPTKGRFTIFTCMLVQRVRIILVPENTHRSKERLFCGTSHILSRPYDCTRFDNAYQPFATRRTPAQPKPGPWKRTPSPVTRGLNGRRFTGVRCCLPATKYPRCPHNQPVDSSNLGMW